MHSGTRSKFATIVIGSAGAGLLLVLYGAIRFPASIASAPVPFVLSVAGLTGYIIAGVSARRAPERAQSALGLGGVVGGVLATAGVFNHTLEVAATLPSGIEAILGPGMWGLIFLAFAIACSATFMRSQSVSLGLLSSVWSGLVYASVSVAVALAFGFAFMVHMERILAGLYAASGTSDREAFVTRHLVTNASSHLFIAPFIALLVGGASTVACVVLRSVRPRTAVALSCVSLTLFVAGIASIRFAESLARAQRPPFIEFGLAALGTTLASAYPLIAAARRRESPI